jgi:hypothetical protein
LQEGPHLQQVPVLLLEQHSELLVLVLPILR